MKKIASFAIVITVLSISITGLADAAATDSGKIAAETIVTGADDYSTVLITDSSGNIVYIDQADGLFDATMPFLIKSNPDYGKYTVQLGGKNADPTSTYFYVGVDAPKTGDVTMKRLQNEETPDSGTTYKIGYCAEVNANYASTYNSLKVGYDGNPTYGGVSLNGGAWDETHYSGSGDLYIIFQLNDVPKAWKDSITVFLSPDSVDTESVQ